MLNAQFTIHNCCEPKIYRICRYIFFITISNITNIKCIIKFKYYDCFLKIFLALSICTTSHYIYTYQNIHTRRLFGLTIQILPYINYIRQQ